MKVIWMTLGILSFIGGQLCLLHHLKKIDRWMENDTGNETAASCDDSCGYPDEDVLE